MHNLLFLLLEYLVSALIILLALRFMKKEGAYVALTTLIIASNLGVAKLFNLFGMEVTAANMSMGMAFVIYSIITEVYGQKRGKKGSVDRIFRTIRLLIFGFDLHGIHAISKRLSSELLITGIFSYSKNCIR